MMMFKDGWAVGGALALLRLVPQCRRQRCRFAYQGSGSF